MSLAVGMREGPMPRSTAASGSWEGPGDGFSPEPPEGANPANTVILAPCDPGLDLQNVTVTRFTSVLIG